MKIYKVTFHNHTDSSQGFKFFASKAEATKSLNKFKKREGENYEADISGIDTIDMQPTKTGIIHVLNVLASHPDNG